MVSFYWWSIEWSRKGGTEDLDSSYSTIIELTEIHKMSNLYYYLEALLFGFLIFWFKNAPTFLYLCRDKTKGQSGKNTTLTPIKTLPIK